MTGASSSPTQPLTSKRLKETENDHRSGNGNRYDSTHGGLLHKARRQEDDGSVTGLSDHGRASLGIPSHGGFSAEGRKTGKPKLTMPDTEQYRSSTGPTEEETERFGRPGEVSLFFDQKPERPMAQPRQRRRKRD